MLFWTRFATGIAKANSIPVHQSLIADNYPIGIRARMSSVMNMGSHGIGLASPVLCAAIATWAGGVEGWRWAWFILGIPVILVALLAFKMKEPPRGQFEKQDVLGEVIEDAQPAPVSMEAAFARIKRIRTIRTVLVAFCALGFGLFSQPALESLYLEDTLHVNDLLQRGLILSLSGIAALPILPFVGRYFDRVYRIDPAKALAIVGALILPSALLVPIQFSVESSTLFWILKIPQSILTASAFAMVGPVLQAVVPYRLRGMGTAMSTLYIFFIGGFMGGLVAAFFTDAIGVRGTVIAPRRAQCDHRRSAADERCALHPQRPLAGRRGVAGGTGGAPASASSRTKTFRSCSSRTSTSRTDRCRCSSASTSTCERARRSRSSARTARASRRCCASSAASRFPNAVSSASTGRTSRTSRRSSGPSS